MVIGLNSQLRAALQQARFDLSEAQDYLTRKDADVAAIVCLHVMHV
jgi:hypothetical protein